MIFVESALTMDDPGESSASHYAVNKEAVLATLNMILALHFTERYPMRLAYNDGFENIALDFYLPKPYTLFSIQRLVIYLPETGGYEARFEHQEKWFESLDAFEGFLHNWLAKVRTQIDAAFAEWEQEYPLD